MDFYFIDNQNVKMSDVLVSTIPTSKTAKVAVAFAKHSGIKLIEESLMKCLDNGGNIEFVVGLDFHTTDATVLKFFTPFRNLIRKLIFTASAIFQTILLPIIQSSIFLKEKVL